jgi:hypothetical protein
MIRMSNSRQHSGAHLIFVVPAERVVRERL